MLFTKLFRNRALFSLRKVGNQYVPELPTYKVNEDALRPFGPNEEQLNRDAYYSMIEHFPNIKEYPQCRYFAVEYKNRVHHVFNAYYYPMGRMINKIATAIRGRNSPLYRNVHADVKNGDICIIVNAVDPLFTGKKLKFKNLRYHTGFIGNLRTFSYRSVLNKKPELLYYYLLRKAMPKNKITQDYMQNVKIYRGPTHDFKDIPQFTPEKHLRDGLTELDLQKYIEQFPEDQKELLFDADEESSILGKDLDADNEKEPSLQTDETLESESKKKISYKKKAKDIEKFEKLRKRIINRYKTVRAPYKDKKKSKDDPGFEFFHDEKKARKSPFYEELANEDLIEVDEQLIEDPMFRKGFDKE